ncbi:MAG: cob(I)yrinic acid a,c-diamide adenosyltransferase [Prolixibacteraceae bacterium]|nr:cob(I)yrinic acid a,c-diamide adenosyltransferase [Prolixibacteraceae bacterium]
MNSFIHVYTGNGKGKTTAAFGLALRAAGAGKKVFFAQFVKGKTYAEIEAVNKWLPSITIKQFGRGCFIVNKPKQEDIDEARKGLSEIKRILQWGSYDLVVLDEANIAIYYKLFTVSELIEILKERNHSTEVVVTGRYAPQELIDAADLVTEMKEIKHYYQKGVEARKGIEF